MAFQKKELDEVKEQPGSKQKKMPVDKKVVQIKESKEKGEKSEKKHKSDEGYHETGLNHPSAQYDSYKRPRKG